MTQEILIAVSSAIAGGGLGVFLFKLLFSAIDGLRESKLDSQDFDRALSDACNKLKTVEHGAHNLRQRVDALEKDVIRLQERLHR